MDEFAELQIDAENESDEEGSKPKLKNRFGSHEIIQLPTNRIPKGLVPLEKLFDHNDVAVKLEKKKDDSDTFQFNMSDEKDPKFVNLASHLNKRQKAKYGELMKEFADIFAWKYGDLKTYDTEIIQHKIPLKEDTNPFRQKLRSFNPMLLPIMEKEIKKLLDAKIIIPLRYS